MYILKPPFLRQTPPRRTQFAVQLVLLCTALPLASSGGPALGTTLFALGMVISFARNEPACRRALAARPRVVRRSLAVFTAREVRQ